MARCNILVVAAIAVPAIGLLLSTRCAAQVDPWEFEVYPYATNPQGMAEFETDNAVAANGHSDPADGLARGTLPSRHAWYGAYEVAYGLTDRIEAAAYLNMALPNGGRYQWAGDNLRLRGRLFDEGVLPVDLGWYAEWELHRTPQFDDAKQEVELRPILEKDLGPVSLLLNPKFEKSIAGAGRGDGFEFGCAAGLRYRWDRRISPGLEYYCGTGLIDHSDPIQDQEHYLFATLWGELAHGLEYDIGVGSGLTRGSDHLVLKFNLEVERFLGALLGPGSGGGWFR